MRRGKRNEKSGNKQARSLLVGLPDMKNSIMHFFDNAGAAVLRVLEKLPILRRLLNTHFRLSVFVTVALLIASYVSFNVTYLVISYVYRNSFVENADEVSDAVAHQIHNSMLQLMQRGWSRDDLITFIESLEGMGGRIPFKVEIYRSEAVEREYGKVHQPVIGINVEKSFKTGDTITYKPYPTIINIYPIKASEGCLKCHPYASVGQVLGVIKIQQDIGQLILKAERRFNLFFFILLPVPFIMAWVVAASLNARIRRATVSLHEKIDEINSVKDLTKADSFSISETGITELNAILIEFSTLARKIQAVAVDREVFEFEIRLLEKFIITSEVVQDWKEHVLKLLLEVNKVITVHTLFSIFQVDKESYDLDIFWARDPSKDMKAKMEKIIRQKVGAEHDRYRDISLKVSHNTTHRSTAELELGEEDVELQTKSIFVETPRIGGVVGIGVQSHILTDTIRSLVIDGILSTLLNVVGSIKAMYKYTKELEYYAMRDPMTNLYNQRLFWELLGYEIGRARRHNEKFTLIVIDVDNFKHLNDSHGHLFGDKFLAGIAATIRSSLREGDILARYGGDEFVVILPETDEEQGYLIANRVAERTALFSMTAQDGTNARVTISIGLAVYPSHAESTRDLFMFADNMMYKAKNMGKNTVVVPTEEDMMEVFRTASKMTVIITKALDERTVFPYFQPIINVETGSVEGHEVLSRIRTDKGIMEAAEFIEITERLGIVSRLDHVVMERVFRKAEEEGYEGYLFINLSPKSLILKDFIPKVLELTDRYNIDHRTVVFEITERETIKNISLLEKFVCNLKIEGYKFAIDDFGSGFSSFSYLRSFPIDFLKIEGDFIRNMIEDRRDLAFVRTMSALAKEFGIQSIVESVENESILNAVKQLGINLCQGYHVGRPAPEFMMNVH